MIKLSVNINKIATLRNARGGNKPDVVQVAIDCQHFGADGITVHPRPDERHIRYADVYALRKVVHTEFNIEGYPSEDFLDLVFKVKPEQVTLVPDPPEVLTSNAGWDTIKNEAFLRTVVDRIKSAGMRVSLFLDPNPLLVEPAAATGADRIELYTEAYARHFPQEQLKALDAYIKTAELATQLGLGINAGHDLDLDNLNALAVHLPGLMEVSIGHALISDALYYGLHNTIQLYKAQLERTL